jgi:two-component system, NtrC family, sensor kinase
MRILHLEDNASDAELIRETLLADGVSEVQWVDTRDGFLHALEENNWDVILADYSLPNFDGISALQLAVQTCRHVPFIFVSGALGEEVAVETLKIGATDYVLKHRLSRLAPAVRRAVREAEERYKRYEADRAREAAQAELEANRMQMVVSDRLSALGMMAGSLAHEINNPVGCIHALAGDLLDMAEGGQVPRTAIVQNCSRILQTCDRIARIVKSLRTIARDGSADTSQPAAVAKIVEQTLELCKERFRANGVSVLLPSIDRDLCVPCREVQIAQVLLNLLQNAFDAVLEQDGEKWVRLELAVRDQSLVLSVIDNGRGVPPELRHRIMEPFFTTKPVGKGTGLGLSLSKAIAEQHGGKLELSETDGHTCFSLLLPIFKETGYATEECHSVSGR